MNIPKYINEKSNIIRLVSFTALFALIFINIYKPFDSSSWYKVTDFMFFVYSSLIILTGVLVVIISRIIMYFFSKNHDISYWIYSAWVLLEILFMALFYTFYTLSVNAERDSMLVFKSSIINTALVLLLPYGVLTLYFAWRESNKRLDRLENGQFIENKSPRIISFKDDKETLRLSVSSENLLYIEATDNYVIIHYLNKGRVKNYLLRNTLKHLEAYLEKSSVGRCHRSFLVNFDRVKVFRKSKDGLVLELDAENTPEIPVSKTYQESISQKFLGDLK